MIRKTKKPPTPASPNPAAARLGADDQWLSERQDPLRAFSLSGNPRLGAGEIGLIALEHKNRPHSHQTIM